MLAVFLGAILGALFGGFTGMLIGAGLGYALSWWVQRTVFGSLRIAQEALLDSTFSVMGALCKADSVVTRDEIKVVEGIFAQLRLSPEQKTAAKAAFNRGKADGFDLDAAVDGFAAVVRGRGPLVQLFLQLQCMAIAADGKVHPAEHEMLVRIARRLGLGEHDVAQLEALLRTATGAGARSGQASPQSRLKDAYQALGLTPEATPAEIKRTYRKLMSENHPDKLASRGLPESMRPVAEERTREINSAYDVIKEARGI